MTINKSIYNYCLFLSSISILLFEMTEIRVFSYSLTPILAYTAISLAMTGFGIGAMLSSLFPSFGKKNTTKTLAILCLLQAISIVLSNVLFTRVSWNIVLSFQHNVFPLVFEILIPCIVPHFFMGLFVAIVFSSNNRIGKVYFWNLFGAGIGCVAIGIFIQPLGAENLIIISALLSSLASLVLAFPKFRSIVATALGFLIFGIVSLFFSDALLPFAPDPLDTAGFRIRAALANAQKVPIREFSEWNVAGRVEVWDSEQERVFVPEDLPFRVLTADSGGTTQMISDGGDGIWGSYIFDESIYGIGYGIKPAPKNVLVLGCGGGLDVQTALFWKAKHVTCVEINSSTIKAVKGPYAAFLKWPTMTNNVTLLHDDGRSFAKATSQKFDIIQLTGTDTMTVHATGSARINEDSLYTVEAFIDYLRILQPNGIISVLRFGEDYIRLTAIATEALLKIGVSDPGKSIVSFRQDGATGIIVKRQALTEEELDDLERFASREKHLIDISVPPLALLGFIPSFPIEFIYLPGRIDNPVFKRYFNMARIVPESMQEIYAATSVVVPTDDKPYYWLSRFMANRYQPEKFIERFEVVGTFLISVLLVAIVFILLPVAMVRRHTASFKPVLWILPYFFGIGLCFVLIEICIVHIFAIFLGSPGASLTVCFTSILLFSGIGSYLAEFIPMKPLKKIGLATLVLVISGISILSFSEPVFDAVFKSGAGQITRGFISGLMIAPLGLAMGWFFPTGLNCLKHYMKGKDLIPWAVSVSGFASVFGSVVVLPFSMIHGFRALFGTAVVGYVIVAFISLLFLYKRKEV